MDASSYRWLVVLGTFLMTFSYAAPLSFGVFIDSLQTEFGWSRTEVALGASVHAMTYFFSALLMGHLVDRYGPRKMVLLGALLVGGGVALSAFVDSLPQLYAFYGLMAGMGVGSIYVSLVVVITASFTEGRGLAMALAYSGLNVGLLMMAPLADFLIITRDWRLAFLSLGLTSWAIMTLGGLFVRQGLNVGHPGQGDRSISSNIEVSLTARKAIKTRRPYLLIALYMLVPVSMSLLSTHFVVYSTGMGFDSSTAAIALGLLGGFTAFGRVSIGAVSDRVGRKPVLIGCYVLLAVAFLLLLLTRDVTSSSLYAKASVLGFALGGLFVLFPAMIGSFFGPASIGTIYGLIDGVSWGVGGTVGPVLGGYSFDATGSYHPAFLLMVALSFFAAVASLFLKTPKRSTAAGKV